MKNRQFFATRSATANLVILSGFYSHRFLSIWQSYGHKSGVSHFVTCVHLALYHKAIIAAWQLDPRSFSSYSFFDITFLSHFYSPGGGATVKSRQFCQIYVAITVTLLCYPDSRSQIPQFWIMELKKIGSMIAIRNILSMWWINMFVSSCSGLWSKWFWDTCGCSSIHVMNLHSQESLIFHIAVLIIELSPTSSMKPSVVVCPCIRYVNVSGSFKNGFM